MPFGCTINLRSNNEPSRSQASLACGKACQSRQASQRMSVGPGSRIRALSMPEFSSFRRLRRARPRCGSEFARPIAGCGTRYLVARNQSGVCRFRSWVRCFRLAFAELAAFLFAAQGFCTVFSCRSPSLSRVICRSTSRCRAFLPFEESAVCVGDKFGPWPLDD